MREISAAIGVAFVVLVLAPQAAEAARICKNGRLYYSGSDFHADRSEAVASAVEAWRRIKAASEGTSRAQKMFPHTEQLHCEQATTKEGWRCFVRGGHCHHA